jgi:phosphoadenosine phosphosulfate reductase
MDNWQKELTRIASKDGAVFSTSFSLEDQIITDFIAINNLNIEIFTIDTGRLFDATYEIWQRTLDKYDIKVKTYYPNKKNLQKFITKEGINPFYNSKDLRLNCCNIRKVEPLHRALIGKSIWISGLRSQHSINRKEKDFFEYDEKLRINKFYPLLALDINEVWEYIRLNNIPYNSLYNKGFESIGCAPCTRSGKHRDGRWWWEKDDSKECGLHIVNKKVIRNDK